VGDDFLQLRQGVFEGELGGVAGFGGHRAENMGFGGIRE
jgi:hypothetical protein